MKYPLLLLFLLIAPLFSQSLELAKEGYVKVYEATEKLDFETIMDMSYPKLLELGGRAALIAEMKKAFTDPNIKLTFVKTEFKPEYSPVQEIKGHRFCVIRRHTIMKITFKNPLNAEQVKAIQTNIARSNPSRTLSFNAQENAFSSTGPDISLAISDSLTKNQWRFLTYEPGQAFLLESWFGKDVLTQLPLPAVKPAAPAPVEADKTEWKRPESLSVENGKVEFKGEDIPIYNAPETKVAGFDVSAEGNKLSYSLFRMKNDAKAAKGIAAFYKGKTIFGKKIGSFEETTDVGMPALESRNCGAKPKQGNMVKIATDSTGHHVEIFAGCPE